MHDSQLTWREGIAAAMEEAADPGPIVRCTLTDAELDVKFDAGYGGTEGVGFTAWTASRVYFPVQYDGSEWVGSAPREPSDEVTNHIGGG